MPVEEKSSLSVSISPSVVFSMGEIYQRRNEQAPCRVIGALFGSSQGGVVSATQCFVVPHSEVGDQISINSEYYKNRTELHKKCYGRLSNLVGWFSVTQDGFSVSEKNTHFINELFCREVAASGLSAVSVHFNLHISANGEVKQTSSITEIPTKTFNENVSTQVSFASNETFAASMVAAAVEANPEVDTVEIEKEISFVERKLKQLTEELEQIKALQAKIQSGEMKEVDPAVIEAIKAALATAPQSLLKAKERLDADSASLLEVCKSIRAQLDILNDLVLYHA